MVSAELHPNQKKKKSNSCPVLPRLLGLCMAQDLPDVVQSHIPLDILGKVVCISRFTAKSHGEVGTQSLELVLVRLHTDDGSSCTHI